MHQRTIGRLLLPALFSTPILQTDCAQVEEDKIHVAVVDDDDSFGRAISRLLRAAGFEPVGYSLPRPSWRTRLTLRRIVCCSTFTWGALPVWSCAGTSTASGSAIPVIFVSGHDEPKIREEAQQAGCSAYLRKPVSGHLLIEAITKAVHPGNH